ncbi:MAG: tetratricopeptide repeat protein, partial [Planctomycetota bacterium]
RLYQKNRREESALSDFKAAAASAQGDDSVSGIEMVAKANTAAGLIYVKNGVLGEAEDHFQIAVDAADSSPAIEAPEAYVGLGELKLKKEQYKDAIVSFHKGLRLPKEKWTREEDRNRGKRGLGVAHTRSPKRIATSLLKQAKKDYDDIDKLKSRDFEKVGRDRLKWVRSHLLYSALKIDPGLTDASLLKARVLLDEASIEDEAGEDEEAEKKIKAAGSIVSQALKRDNRNQDARYMLATIYVLRARRREKQRQSGSGEDWAKAEQILRGLRRAYPKELKYHNLLGRVYYAQKQYRKAEREWREALKCEGSERAKEQVLGNLQGLKKQPLFVKANELSDAGVQKLIEGDLGAAEKKFRQACELDPLFAVALTNLSLSLFEQGETEGAISYLARSLKLDPDIHQSLILKGRIYKRQGQTSRALEAFTEAKRIGPGDPEVHYQLALLAHEQKKIRQAKLHIRDGIAINPEHYPSQVLLARMYMDEGALSKAEIQAELAWDNSGRSYPGAIALLAEIRLKKGDTEGAMEAAIEASGLDPADPEPFRVIGVVQEGDGRRDKAAESYFLAGLRHRSRGENGKAEAMLERAHKLAPDQSAILGELGLQKAVAGNYQEAITNLRDAINRDPNNLDLVFKLATVYEEMGETKAAADKYLEVINKKGEVRDRNDNSEKEAYWLPRMRYAGLYKPGAPIVTKTQALRRLREAGQWAPDELKATIQQRIQEVNK